MTTTLTWKKRTRRDETDLSTRRIWETKCGRYRVIEAVSKTSLPTVYYAIEVVDLPGTTERIISNHRKQGPAVAACERHANQRTS